MHVLVINQNLLSLLVEQLRNIVFLICVPYSFVP